MCHSPKFLQGKSKMEENWNVEKKKNPPENNGVKAFLEHIDKVRLYCKEVQSWCFFLSFFFMPSDLLALYLLKKPCVDRNLVERQYIVKLIRETRATLPGFRSWLLLCDYVYANEQVMFLFGEQYW